MEMEVTETNTIKALEIAQKVKCFPPIEELREKLAKK
jgi:hypothetical protein